MKGQKEAIWLEMSQSLVTSVATQIRCGMRVAESGGADYVLIVMKSIGLITSLAVSVSLSVAVSSAFADQITLRNGDVLNGKVLSMTADSLMLQDDSLGTLTLPRVKVSNITFGTVTAVLPSLTMPHAIQASPGPTPGPKAAASSPSQANSFSDLQGMLREVRQHSNLVQEVEAQVLGSSASPEAVNKFNELLDGLSTGQIDMNGLRSEAQSAANELQEYKKELGPDASEEMDGYLSILNNFLRETSPTNSP